MRNIQVGVRVARQIRTTEHAVDRAMIEVCRLVQTALESRAEAHLAAEVGQAVLADMVQGLSQLAQVRGAVISAHDGLAKVAEDHQIGWNLDGTREDKTGNPVAPVLSVAA